MWHFIYVVLKLDNASDSLSKNNFRKKPRTVLSSNCNRPRVVTLVVLVRFGTIIAAGKYQNAFTNMKSIKSRFEDFASKRYITPPLPLDVISSFPRVHYCSEPKALYYLHCNRNTNARLYIVPCSELLRELNTARHVWS